jgi:hypothetical protein
VLVSTLPDAPAPYQLGVFLLAGHADGSLDAPVRLDLGPQSSTCLGESIVIGDVDGDGRADVVVGSLRVRHPGPAPVAAGTLVPAEHLVTILGSSCASSTSTATASST